MSRSAAGIIIIGCAIASGCASSPEPEPAPPIAAREAPTVVEAPRLEPKRVAPPRKSIDLDAREAKVQDVLGEIARLAGVRIVLRGEAPELVTFSVHEAPWRDVVLWLAHVAKLEVAEKRDVLILTAHPRNVIAACGAPAGPWLRVLAQAAGRNVVMPGRLRGEIDFTLKDVSFDEALAISAATIGCTMIDDEGNLLVYSPR